MLVPQQYHFAVGPVVAMGAVGVLALASRWIFSTRDQVRRVTRRVGADRDYGLLVPVATVRTADDAELLRAVLAAESIRGTVAPAGRAGELQLLVFAEHASRARELVGSA